MKTKTLAAYAAGIFDGEGYVGIDRISRSKGSKTIHYGIRIIISQKDGILMNWLKNNFGGNVYQQRNNTDYSIHRWRIHSQKAKEFMKFIYPYLIIKKEQVNLALAFMEQREERFKKNHIDKVTGKFLQVSKEDLDWILEMKDKLSKLKKVYTPYSN